MMRSFLIATAALFMAQSPASAHSVATRRARAVVAVINASTPKALKAYVDSPFGGSMLNRAPDEYVDLFLKLRERSGGLEWVSVQSDSANRAVIRMRRKLTGEINA